MTDYRPIPCSQYSRYELAILHHEHLRVTWVEQNVIYDQVVRPTDLQTRNHEEFLLCEDGAGRPRTIRLDRIRRCEKGELAADGGGNQDES